MRQRSSCDCRSGGPRSRRVMTSRATRRSRAPSQKHGSFGGVTDQVGQPEERRPYHAGPRSRPGPGGAKRQLIADSRGRGAGPGTPNRVGRPGASTSPGAGIARGAPCRGRRRHPIASSCNPARACSVVSRRRPEMTSARIIGVAVGNGRFQDELCDALRRYCRSCAVAPSGAAGVSGAARTRRRHCRPRLLGHRPRVRPWS